MKAPMLTSSVDRRIDAPLAAVVLFGLVACLVAFAGWPAGAGAACPNEAVRKQQGSEFLPDCRAYEQVTPSDKAGQAPGSGVLQQRIDFGLDPQTNRATYTGVLGAPPSLTPSYSAISVLRGASGWEAGSLFPAPGPVQTGFGFPSIDMNLRAVTPDQRAIAYWDNTSVPNPSLNVRRADGSVVRIAEAANGFASFDLFGAKAGQAWGVAFASADGSRLIFTSNQRLGPAEGVPGSHDILYEWIDDRSNEEAGSLRVVNRTSDASLTLISAEAAELGGSTSNASWRFNLPHGLRNAVSDGTDGHHRVFFQTPAPASRDSLVAGPIFMREDNVRTVEISAPEGNNAPATELRYLDSSKNGQIVYFWAGSQLTDDPGAGEGIYRYDVTPGGEGTLRFIAEATVSIGDPRPPAAMASPDGSKLLFSYWDQGTTPSTWVFTDVGGGDVRKLLDEASERVSFSNTGGEIAATSGPYLEEGRCPSATVTPDGRYFAFAAGAGSERSSSVYRYDTTTGELLNLSQPPALPVGIQYTTVERATFIPCPTVAGAPREFETFVMSDDGRRVFFTSWNALAPGDASPGSDVYEWFDDGSADGRVSLLTKSSKVQRGHIGATFLAADATGQTAYIMTGPEQLAPSDRDELGDVYAVRINGGFLAPSGTDCSGEGCQPTLNKQPTGQNASSSLTGHGRSSRSAACRRADRRARKMTRRARQVRRALKKVAGERGERRLRTRRNRAERRARQARRRAKRCRVGGKRTNRSRGTHSRKAARR